MRQIVYVVVVDAVSISPEDTYEDLQNEVIRRSCGSANNSKNDGVLQILKSSLKRYAKEYLRDRQPFVYDEVKICTVEDFSHAFLD